MTGEIAEWIVRQLTNKDNLKEFKQRLFEMRMTGGNCDLILCSISDAENIDGGEIFRFHAGSLRNFLIDLIEAFFIIPYGPINNMHLDSGYYSEAFKRSMAQFEGKCIIAIRHEGLKLVIEKLEADAYPGLAVESLVQRFARAVRRK